MNGRSFWQGYIIASILTLFVIAPLVLYRLSAKTPSVFNEFQFTDLQGHKVDINALKGKAVVVNLWATWCPPCRGEMPSIVHARKLFQNQNVVFLVASFEGSDKIAAFKKQQGYDMEFYHYSRIDGQKAAQSFPVTYVFDKHGKNVYSRVGAFTWDDEATLKRFKTWFQ